MPESERTEFAANKQRHPYRRADVHFFHLKSTKDALVDLAMHESLVVFCGAGVTIDKTGLGWSELIPRSLRLERTDGQTYIQDDQLGKIAKALGNPQRLASTLRHRYRQRFSNPEQEQAEIAKALSIELYKQNTWRGGRLVDTIARYAVSAVRAGKNVTLVTSNYDTFIEESIDKELERLNAEGEPCPGLKVTVAKGKSPRATKSTDSALKSIGLVYLHGRIHRTGVASGQIVLDEIDYAQRQSHTVTMLKNLLGQDDAAVIIAGASLTDPPLIESLALTRHREARYVLLPITSSGLSEYAQDEVPALSKYLENRFEALGLGWLAPDFKVQVGQFFDELTHCSNLTDPEAYGSTSYGKRLVDWWSQWETLSKDPQFIEAAYEQLRNFIVALRKSLNLSSEQGADGSELLKLEVWVRWKPDDSRSLALWSSSMGVLMERELLRKAALEIGSGHASVCCFTVGQPQHVDLGEVQPPPLAGWRNPYPSRWQSFLSVPIYLEEPDRRFIAGVITLASSEARSGSGIPREVTSKMQEIVQKLGTLGVSLLNADQALAVAQINQS